MECYRSLTYAWKGCYRSEIPEQYCATGWVKGWRYSLVFEIRNDDDGEYYQMVTLWKAR
jgi:hypothetical protein